MTYRLLQTKDMKRYSFMGYDYAKAHGLSLDDYQTVYEGDDPCTTTIDAFLEGLFTKFNLHKPEDFRGHSMSVSDIVEVDGKMYYCDSVGFTEMK